MEEGENEHSYSNRRRVLSSSDSCEMNAVEMAALESVTADDSHGVDNFKKNATELVALESVVAGDDSQKVEEEKSLSPEELWWSPSHEPLAQCLYSVAVCTLRSPAYFKSLYRLADILTQLGLPQVILGTPTHVLC